MKKSSFLMNRHRLAQTFAVVFFTLLFTSCKKEHNAPTPEPDAIEKSKAGLSDQTVAELRAARTATEKYRSLEAAKADGYADINVIQENMGFHYLKSALVDTVFNPEKPEILVYNKTHDGSIQLVAVEYAVPIPLTPNKAPEGFTGSSDNWTYSTVFNLWLLHAWVWEYNPQGIFNPTNPLVHLH
jgi:hypothetical protein